MRRCEFITLRGTMRAAWPLSACTQQAERVRRIGMISGANDQLTQARIAAFRELQQLCWTEGRNVHIDARWSAGNAAEIRRYAAEFVALAPDVIFTAGSSSMGPLLESTRTVPIVFAIVPDPVGSGFVKSLSRPGGNATGFMMFEYSLCGKWPALLKEIAPHTTRAAVLRDPTVPAGMPVRRHPVCCRLGRRGGYSGQPERHRRRARARARGLGAVREWRPDPDVKRAVGAPS